MREEILTRKIKIPEGKTAAICGNEKGYIDAYISGADRTPCAVFVRLKDGGMDLVPICGLKAYQKENNE